jgi:NitT/TauT family transport system substrate-binding protein
MSTPRLSRRTLLAAALATPALARAARAQQAKIPLRIGLLHTLSPAPLYIAMQRGYFADQGLDASFRFFEAAQPIAAAAVSGDIDVGITALTGGFFSLAGRGALRVIGGGLHEERGFKGTAILVSNKAYDAGLTSLDKLGGHSFGITQYGSSFHYMIGQVAAKEGFDLKLVTLRPLQDIGNMIAAVQTAQVDATMAIASQALPLAAAGQAHIIGWVGDIAPYQLTAVFTTERMIKDHPDTLRRFAAAYQKGVADYRDAFLRLDAEGQPVHDATTDAVIPLIQKYVFTGDPDATRKIIAGIGYYDAGGALDVQDVANQLHWFEAQGMVKGGGDASDIIDTQFLPALHAAPG